MNKLFFALYILAIGVIANPTWEDNNWDHAPRVVAATPAIAEHAYNWRPLPAAAPAVSVHVWDNKKVKRHRCWPRVCNDPLKHFDCNCNCVCKQTLRCDWPRWEWNCATCACVQRWRPKCPPVKPLPAPPAPKPDCLPPAPAPAPVPLPVPVPPCHAPVWRKANRRRMRPAVVVSDTLHTQQ